MRCARCAGDQAMKHHFALLPVLIASLCACVRIHAPPPPPSQPPLLIFQDVHYDGRYVTGRLLVGARAPTVLDRRMIENTSIGISLITDCETGEKLPTLFADTFPTPPRENDLLVLKAGEWFGKEVAFLVFTDPFTPPTGPECIDFQIFFTPESEPVAPTATVQARARREDVRRRDSMRGLPLSPAPAPPGQSPAPGSPPPSSLPTPPERPPAP